MSDNARNVSETIEQNSLVRAIPFWQAPTQFAVHVLVGTCIFAIIAGAAVVLELAVRKLELYGIGRVVILGLKAAEYSLFGVDLFLFACFLWRTANRTVKQL